jgi:hypothetical protein
MPFNCYVSTQPLSSTLLSFLPCEDIYEEQVFTRKQMLMLSSWSCQPFISEEVNFYCL